MVCGHIAVHSDDIKARYSLYRCLHHSLTLNIYIWVYVQLIQSLYNHGMLE